MLRRFLLQVSINLRTMARPPRWNVPDRRWSRRLCRVVVGMPSRSARRVGRRNLSTSSHPRLALTEMSLVPSLSLRGGDRETRAPCTRAVHGTPQMRAPAFLAICGRGSVPRRRAETFVARPRGPPGRSPPRLRASSLRASRAGSRESPVASTRTESRPRGDR